MQKAYEFDFVYDTQAAFRLLLEALSKAGDLNMDGWGANEKYPHAFGEPSTSINLWQCFWTMRSVLQSAVLLRWQRKLLS